KFAVLVKPHRIASGVDLDIERLALHPRPGPACVHGPHAPHRDGHFLAFGHGLTYAQVEFLAAVPYDVAVMRDCPACSTDIDVAAVRAVPGVWRTIPFPGGVGRVAQGGPSETRLAQVIDGGP